MHTWLSSSVSFVLCFFISLHAVIDVRLLPIFMWLSRLEYSEGSDWMKSVLHCMRWDYPAPGQTEIRLFFYLLFSGPLYHLHLLTPSLPVGEWKLSMTRWRKLVTSCLAYTMGVEASLHCPSNTHTHTSMDQRVAQIHIATSQQSLFSHQPTDITSLPPSVHRVSLHLL